MAGILGMGCLSSTGSAEAQKWGTDKMGWTSSSGDVSLRQQVVTHRRWTIDSQNDGVLNGVTQGWLRTEGVVVGQWLRTLLPSPGRMRAGRFTVVQLVTSDCHLMIAVEVRGPQRERVEQTVACIELAGSRWFPLNGSATLVTGGDGPDELKVTLAEVV